MRSAGQSGAYADTGKGWTDLGGGADALLDPLSAVLVRLVDERKHLDVCEGEAKRQPQAAKASNGERGLTRVEVLSEQVVVVLADGVEEPGRIVV